MKNYLKVSPLVLEKTMKGSVLVFENQDFVSDSQAKRIDIIE